MSNSSEPVTGDLLPYLPPGEDEGGGNAGARAGTGSGTDEPGPDDQVRIWTTERLRAFIHTLQPYIDGTFGEVSPRHGSLYLRAVQELNRIWNARYLPPPPEPEPEPEEQEQAREVEQAALVRQRVLDQLEQLRARSGTQNQG